MTAIRILGLLLTLTAQAVHAQASTPAVSPESLSQQFDCEGAFDLVALMVIFRCAAYVPPPSARRALDAAVQRLRKFDLIDADEQASTRIAFCPLAAGTGMVPTASQLYLDDGLISLSTDGLTEIMAHELVHVRQFVRLGERGFKCAYVQSMAACGGCQDRRHFLEQEAYAHQDAVRHLLSREAAGERNIDGAADGTAVSGKNP